MFMIKERSIFMKENIMSIIILFIVIVSAMYAKQRLIDPGVEKIKAITDKKLNKKDTR